MSFVVTLALLIALLAALPIVAHLLRRGRAPTIDFPATKWVLAEPHTAAKRSKVFDRALLAVRGSIIVTLALLGAGPLVRCDRKILDRVAGASIARVLVLDDSGSMRAEVSPGRSRFDVAKATALSLIDQLREGDSMAIVLASKPARLLLAPSLSPSTLRSELKSLPCSDKPTELAAAIQLSRTIVEHQPQTDKKVLLLSDRADPRVSPTAEATNVLPELGRTVTDCALSRARRQKDSLEVEIVCNHSAPTHERSVELLDSSTAKHAIARSTFLPTAQGQVLFTSNTIGAAFEKAEWVRFGEHDDNPANDSTPIITTEYGRVIGYYSDPTTNRPSTGGPPILEQALRAIEPDWTVLPLSTVPDDERELAELSVLLLDDPPNLSAEARSAITAFAKRGNAAIALFGPAASAAQLGSLHLPFLEQQADWEPSAPPGLERTSLPSTLAFTAGLEQLAAKGRFVFDESHDPKTVVRARWSDQKPFWLERPEGSGTLSVLGLPSSVVQSDWALRPGFLSLLEHLVTGNERRGKARVITTGDYWQFEHEEEAVVMGPLGPLTALASPASEQTGPLRFIADRVGRYQIRRGKELEERIALWPSEETLQAPQSWPVTAGTKPNQVTGQLDISRYFAIGLVALLALEQLLRLQGVKGWLQKLAGKLRTYRRSNPNR
jgi:Mg-chelatase subunit ChlD